MQSCKTSACRLWMQLWRNIFSEHCEWSIPQISCKDPCYLNQKFPLPSLGSPEILQRVMEENWYQVELLTTDGEGGRENLPLLFACGSSIPWRLPKKHQTARKTSGSWSTKEEIAFEERTLPRFIKLNLHGYWLWCNSMLQILLIVQRFKFFFQWKLTWLGGRILCHQLEFVLNHAKTRTNKMT